MPFISKRQVQCIAAARQRWSNNNQDRFDILNVIDCSMDSGNDAREEEEEEEEEEQEEEEQEQEDKNYEFEIDNEEDEINDRLNYKDIISLFDIVDLFQLCKAECNSRYLSTLIYMILRYFQVPYSDARDFLKSIGALSSQIAHKWSRLFTEGNFDEFLTDGRGGQRGDRFFDVYPELEIEAKVYAIQQCQQKSAAFTVSDLANYIDERFYELNNIIKTDCSLVRSVESCRLDLRRWGAIFDSNKNRPYFEGHDRPDVLAYRETFINHFLSNKDNYYTIKEDGDPQWIPPKTPSPTIIICKKNSFLYFT